MVLTSAPRTFVEQNAKVSRMEGGSFPKCGYRFSVAHIRLKGCKRSSVMEGGSFSHCGSRNSTAQSF
eukprot:3708742-Pyramimonas_sp.AAC.1